MADDKKGDCVEVCEKDGVRRKYCPTGKDGEMTVQEVGKC